MIRQVAGASKYIAVVVDEETLRVLSACCSVYEVLCDGVTGKLSYVYLEELSDLLNR